MTGETIGPTPRQLQWRASRGVLLVELLLVTALFAADAHHMVPFSKTPWLLLLGWGSLRLRGIRWQEIGFSIDSKWREYALAGVFAGIVIEALELFVTQPLLAKATGQLPDLSDFSDMVGNFYLLSRMLVATWVVFALGEELVWRGYVLNRLADLFGRNQGGWAVALVLCSVAFGEAHAYQGSIGVIENIIDGALLAGLYLACGRNLLAPVIAHGVTDTVDFLLIFSGHYPGVGQ